MSDKNQRLGRGLSSLISSNKYKVKEDKLSVLFNDEEKISYLNQVILVDISKIHAGVYQPRKIFNDEKLEELSESIKTHGVIQPIIIRKVDHDEFDYEIIAGERRCRAAKLAGKTQIPALVKEVADDKALEMAIIENVQRQDLSPIEEANGYKRLVEEFGYSQREIAEKLGYNRSYVSNSLRLLSLPDHVLEMIDRGEITAGHGKAIVSCENIDEIVDKIIKNNLSVRQTEELARRQHGKIKDVSLIPDQKYLQKNKLKHQYLRTLEDVVGQKTGLKIKASYNLEKKQGKLVIAYNELEEIEKLLTIIK